MASKLITLPFRPTINLRGGVEAGAKLFVYSTGTTTPVSVYSDSALSTPLTNPVVADAFGVFPDVYYNDALTVRVVVQQANGTVLSDTDPYVSDAASAEASADAAATSAAIAEASADAAATSAAIAEALTGPLYGSIAAGLAATSNTDEFAVDNGDGTATIYLNNAGTELERRTIVIDPANAGTAGLLGYSQGGTGAATRTVEVKLQEIVSVKDFGATGDGTTDDSAAIQAALDYAASDGEPYPTVYFPRGTYICNTGLTRTGSGNYVDLKGAGQRGTIIRAGAAMTALMTLSGGNSEVHRSTRVEGITFDGNDLADYCVDAQENRKWTFEGNECRNAAVAAMRGGNWNTRIKNNVFEQSPIGFLLEGRSDAQQAANNFTFTFNDVNNCPIGMQIEKKSNDVVIAFNSFDLCEDAGIFAKEGGRNFDITKNYFERCGRDISDVNGTGVPVRIDGSTTTDLAAAIVLNHDPSSNATSGTIANIADNFFANCNDDRLVILTNVVDITTKNNRVHDTYQTDLFVDLRGFACSSTCRRLEIDESHLTGEVGRLVGLNGLDPEDNHMNIQVHNHNKTGGEIRATGLYWNNPNDTDFWTKTGSGTITEGTHQGQRTFTIQATDPTDTELELDIDLDSLSGGIRGRYFRVHGQTRGASASTGVFVKIFTDASSTPILQFTRSGADWIEFGRGATFYVPTDAVKLRCVIEPLSGSQNAMLKGFCLCDASIPLDAVPVL